MAQQLPSFVQKLLDKFSNSRDFTISFALHAILVAIFSGTVLFQAVQEPPDFEGGSGGFVEAGDATQAPPPQEIQPQQTTFDVTVSTPSTSSPINTITTTAANPLNFSMNPTIAPVMTTTPSTTAVATATTKPGNISSDGLTPAAAAGIKGFTGGWGTKGGPGTGIRSREFEFTAYIAQYNGGNWNSTVRVRNGRIEMGSLPNLLYVMSSWSKDKIKTNYKNVQAIKLDSDEIFKIKPPFIFFTGTRDFKLSDREVENLRKYIQLGGCIWGDASLPGLRSRFDIAFRREMKRVLPDVDKDFEPLPDNHPIFTQNLYFPEIKSVPPGINYYREPVFAMRIYGELAIIYTPNDYGDMWQIGLLPDGKIDMRRNEHNQFVAINDQLWSNRGVYIRNIEPDALAATYKFGTNVVLHLLTRWESKVRTAPTL